MARAKTPEQLVSELIAAAGRNDTVNCEKLLQDGAALQGEFEGLTALHAAAQAGAVRTVKMLLAAGADVHYCTRSRRSCDGDEAFDLAAWKDQYEVCKILLDAGANPVRPQSFAGSPLHLAVMNSDLDLVKIILDHGISSSVDVPGVPEGLTPFQLAVQGSKLDLIRYMADKDDVDLAQRTAAGKTLIQLARNDLATKALLRALKVEKDVRSAAGAAEQLVTGTVPSPRRSCVAQAL